MIPSRVEILGPERERHTFQLTGDEVCAILRQHFEQFRGYTVTEVRTPEGVSEVVGEMDFVPFG